MTVHFPFQNTYAALPANFFARVVPTPVASPRLIKLNRPLAIHLGLDPDRLASPEGTEILAGKRVPEGADPIAMAYAGHQFGHFVPQLGDGRAILLGEVIDADGVRRDIQLKGSGPTPFSRRGDGRAALGPVLREYIISEAMAALGIPTTRSLADDAIARHYPDVRGPDARREGQPYRALFDRVIARQAELIAKWMLVGFIHGVMNTDNCSIAGETIDYGPCAFMDAYNPETVFSSIDHGGRYAYGHQPRIAHWNLARFGETLLPLLADNTDAALAIANEALGAFQARYAEALIGGMRRKLGLFAAEEGDGALAQDLLNVMTDGEADFTLTFRRLDPELDAGVLPLFKNPDAYDAWAVRWRERLAREPQDAAARRLAMRSANPAYIPRNHRVEAALAAAVEREDFVPFEELLKVLARPFEDRAEFAAYAEPPPEDQRVCQTFCGT